jgi:hypothetical protein
MIAGELADFAGEGDGAVRQQDFGLADATRIENDFARRRVTGVVLVAQPEIIVAERDPAALATPADVNDLLPIGQEADETRQRGRRLLLGLCFELVRSCLDAKKGLDPILSKKAERTRAAILMSAGEACSSGLWLTPPRQRTNSMAKGMILSKAMASWPAPLDMRRGAVPELAAAAANNSESFSSQCAAGA